MKTILPILACLPVLALFTAGCSTHETRRDNVSSAHEREFNPESREYEWKTPDRQPVSPGGSPTSRSPYR